MAARTPAARRRLPGGARPGSGRRARSRAGPLAAAAFACLASTNALNAADPVTPAGAEEAGARPDTAIVVTDDRGVRVMLDAPPRRIVSLLPSLTETVCALGACERLVGTDRFSDWPEPVQRLPRLGGFEDVQVERLFALAPDLVLAAESARVIERLESLGLTVVAVEPRSLEDARRAVELLGRVLGLPGEAGTLLARIDEQRRAAAARIPPDWLGARAYFEVSSTPYAAGESSFIGELLAGLGLGNIVPTSLGPFPKLNPEYVVRADPDLILGSTGAIDGMATRPGWAVLSAIRKGRVCAFEERRHDVLVRPGPRLGEAAGILADCVAGLPPGPMSTGEVAEDDDAR